MKKEKITDIILITLIFVSILMTIIIKPIKDLDELWNYNFARNFANGLIPYKDYNMVVTPLLAIITGVILKITVDELIVMRILAAILGTLIIYKIFQILRMLNIRKSLSIINIFIVMYLLKDTFCIDYNWACVYTTLIIIYYELKFYLEDEKIIKCNKKRDIFLGVLAGITILFKQTVGICTCIVLLGNKLLFVRKKDDFYVYLKSFLYRCIGIILTILLLIIYLWLNNAISDFISYTIIGISEFNNYISYFSMLEFNLLGILSAIVPVAFVTIWIKTVILDKDKISYLILVYGIATFSICFPISGNAHFYPASTIAFLLILYNIYLLLINCELIMKISKKLIKIEWIFIVIVYAILAIYSGKNIKKYIINLKDTSTLEHFKFVNIEKNVENQIKIIDNYIENEDSDVKILEASAAAYMIPLNRYNKDYDMFNCGNFGKDGINRIINEISNENNLKLLILKDEYRTNWQTPTEIIDYVKNNKQKVGELLIYDIYE